MTAKRRVLPTAEDQALIEALEDENKVQHAQIITLREQKTELLRIISVLVYKWDQYMERDVKIRNRDFTDARAAIKGLNDEPTA